MATTHEQLANAILDRAERCAHERHAEAYESAGPLNVLAVAKAGRQTGAHWHLRVYSVWVRCSRNDAHAAMVNALRGMAP